MKKIYKLLFVVFFGLMAIACKTTQKEKTLMFQPVTLPEMQAATVDRIGNGLTPRTISFRYAPTYDNFLFHHSYLGDTIWITLNKEQRAVLVNAINTYLESYKAGKLTSANNKKKGFFGQTPCYMEWGLFSVSHYTRPTLRFEYQLIGEKNLPYFIMATATKPAADGTNANSPAIRIALSPAKCVEFLERLDEKKLSEILENLIKDFEKFEIDDEEETQSFFEEGVNEPDISVDPDEDEFIF